MTSAWFLASLNMSRLRPLLSAWSVVISLTWPDRTITPTSADALDVKRPLHKADKGAPHRYGDVPGSMPVRKVIPRWQQECGTFTGE